MKVLVVEDETRIADFVSRGLKEELYAVDVANDGNSAVDFALSQEFNLIILDILLPMKSGVEVCRVLRSKGVTTPILMLTALDAIEDRVKGLDAGADDYLVKPFAFQELLARVRALLRRSGNGNGAMAQVGDLVLDYRTRTAIREGRSIELSAREYALLEFMMKNAGQVLSRAQIISHVWSNYMFATSNVVDVYIRSLRKKVDKDFSIQLIKTVRGMGYKITADS